MATTISQSEAAPSAPWPNMNLNAAATAVKDAAWQRLESYIAWRFAPRVVTWIVEGDGWWKPPLAPTTITAVEVIDPGDNSLISATLRNSPLDGSYCLPGCGPWKFTATVGDGYGDEDEGSIEVPAAVREALVRLANYLAAKPGKPGVTTERLSAGSIDLRTDRSASWMASALQNSGAADLLRPYRRV